MEVPVTPRNARSLVDLFKQNINDRLTELENWKNGMQKYELYK
jgi:hypothetical protein